MTVNVMVIIGNFMVISGNYLIGNFAVFELIHHFALFAYRQQFGMTAGMRTMCCVAGNTEWRRAKTK